MAAGALALLASLAATGHAQTGKPEPVPPSPPPLVDGASRPAGTVPHTPGATVLRLRLAPGDYVVIGTCGVDGASHHRDTTLALLDPAGSQVAFNDDACGSLGSQLRYAVPPDGGGEHAVVARCFDGGTTCGGVVGYRFDDPPPPPPELRVITAARGVLAVDNPGGALLADALIEWRPWPFFSLRLGGTPLGLGGGQLGGVAAGSVHLVGALSLGDVEVGLGGGVAVLSSRFGGVEGQETGVVVTHARLGALDGFHVESQLAFASIADLLEVISFHALARLPFRELDLVFRGAAGNDGVAMGEVAAVVWVERRASRPVLGVSIHAGGAGVFYQPLCRFDGECSARWYAGPMLGLGMEWRP